MNRLLRRLARAYVAVGRTVGGGLAVLAASAAASVVVVLPFWFLATSHRVLFNWVVAGASAAGLAFAAVRRLAAGHGGLAAALRPALLRVGIAAVWLGLLYAALWAFAASRPLAGVAAAAALLLAVGLTAR